MAIMIELRGPTPNDWFSMLEGKIPKSARDDLKMIKIEPETGVARAARKRKVRVHRPDQPTLSHFFVAALMLYQAIGIHTIDITIGGGQTEIKLTTESSTKEHAAHLASKVFEHSDDDPRIIIEPHTSRD